MATVQSKPSVIPFVVVAFVEFLVVAGWTLAGVAS
jgi:hypothetical protein